ncbi:Uncharacterised protein [Mycobacteroides abscessus]|nr:Uncharacterised protein [Mycobacteroides abscessus]
MFSDAQNQGAFLACHQIVDRSIVCGQDAPGMHQQPGAPVGKHHAASVAPNHRLPDRRLQLAYMLTDRGLSQVQHGGGAVESPTIGDCCQRPQRRDIERRTRHIDTLTRSQSLINIQATKENIPSSNSYFILNDKY